MKKDKAIMKRLFFVLLSAACPLWGFAAEYMVNSPDGRIAVTVSEIGRAHV